MSKFVVWIRYTLWSQLGMRFLPTLIYIEIHSKTPNVSLKEGRPPRVQRDTLQYCMERLAMGSRWPPWSPEEVPAYLVVEYIQIYHSLVQTLPPNSHAQALLRLYSFFQSSNSSSRCRFNSWNRFRKFLPHRQHFRSFRKYPP